jgi:hypothetical protein
MPRIFNPKPGFTVGLAKAPALDDPMFKTIGEALYVALENSKEDVVCIWNEIGNTQYLVFQGEVFKRE